MKHTKLKTTLVVSKRMSKVKAKRNHYETRLAKALWSRGIRYRLNYKELPGKPDIVLTKYNIAIFVDGEFWHGKDFDERITHSYNNKEYWKEKIEENMRRDVRNDQKLQEMGWIPIHFWSKDVEKELEACIEDVFDFVEIQIEGKSLEEE